MKREMVCIRCPKGCRMTVEYEGTKVLNVRGNSCSKGMAYAIDEITKPVRIVTSTVKVIDGALPVVPVKTSKAIRRNLIFDVMEKIISAEVTAPIKEGQVILKNPADCGADIISTLDLGKVTHD
jgi:CxxC motif-containing protein